jgi:hypothetical protein
MFRRIGVLLMLSSAALVPTACMGPNGTGNETGTSRSTSAASGAEVTLHVPGMTERLGLT